MKTSRRITNPIWPMLVVLVALAVAAPASATTVMPAKCLCPACATTFYSRSIGSTSTGGLDRDFRPEYLGYPALRLYPITCPICRFTGYEGDFNGEITLDEASRKKFKPHDFPVVPQGASEPAEPDPYREQIVEALTAENPDQPVDPESIRMAARLPSWARYDLLAQSYAAIGRADNLVGDAWLRAGWIIRLDALEGISERLSEMMANPGDWAGDKLDEAARKLKDIPNENDQNLELGRLVESFAMKGEVADRGPALLFALSIYRYHGENTKVLAILKELKKWIDPGELAEYRKVLEEGITWERTYQAKAVAAFEKHLAGTTEPGAELLYLCGELHRRLEHWKLARKYYREAAKAKGAEGDLAVWIKEQEALLPR